VSTEPTNVVELKASRTFRVTAEFSVDDETPNVDGQETYLIDTLAGVPDEVIIRGMIKGDALVKYPINEDRLIDIISVDRITDDDAWRNRAIERVIQLGRAYEFLSMVTMHRRHEAVKLSELTGIPLTDMIADE
jgi:hypothetical protein